jgi:glycosidase
MGENLQIPGRLAVRSPMQWSGDLHGGFSEARRPDRLCRPVTQGPFGPHAVNASSQRRDPGSLLNWFERMIRRRKECPELGHGRMTLLSPGDRAVLAHRCDWHGRCTIALHNLARRRAMVEVELEDADRVEALENLFRDERLTLDDAGRLSLELEPHGHRWFAVHRPGARLLL